MLRVQNGGVILGNWKKIGYGELGMERDSSKDVAKEVVSEVNWLGKDKEWEWKLTAEEAIERLYRPYKIILCHDPFLIVLFLLVDFAVGIL